MISRCTPCRQRRGKERGMYADMADYRCTPCRQRRGKGQPRFERGADPAMHPVQAAPRQRGHGTGGGIGGTTMHPVQAAPRQRPSAHPFLYLTGGCTPCRQRRGKELLVSWVGFVMGCTPCRQRRGKDCARRLDHCRQQDAPRAGSAEAKQRGKAGRHGLRDAPRAGSAKQNNNVPPDGPLTTGRHFFTFHPSRILTLLPSTSVTMYNPVPIFLTDPAWQSRIFPTVPMLSVTGRPRECASSGGSPWE